MMKSKEKKVVDYSTFPVGSLELSDQKTLTQVLVDKSGPDLAMVATIMTAFLFRDTQYMGYLALAIIALLGLTTRLKGDTQLGATCQHSPKEANASRSD